MPSVTVWLGVTTDSIKSPTSHLLSFGYLEGSEVKQYSEVGLNKDNVEWFQEQLLDMIEILRALKAEMKVVGESD